MPTPIDTYFESIAGLAAQAVRAEGGGRNASPPVFDGPQEARSSAWTALAVHPMAVLETEYLSIVNAAEQSAGDDKDLAQERGAEALSRFYALSSDAPPLLQPDAEPLVEERARDLAARFSLVQAMVADGVDGAYDELEGVVADAAELVAAMTSADELAHAAEGVQAAARYLGMFATPAGDASGKWAESHPAAGDVAAYADEVSGDLLRPLLSPANAAASPRCLYNIAPFYLYRLMHRFLGGDQAVPMDLDAKRIASGAATGAMHRADWPWLTGWHEARVVELKDELRALSEKLKQEFDRQDEVIRFFLKGGRAMNTALGTPQDGTNDWDTGILIDPDLTPEQWYATFGGVNDTVVAFLDRARFGYTALLNAHGNELNQARLTAAAAAGAPDLDETAFSHLGMLAEAHEEAAQRWDGSPAASAGTARALKAAVPMLLAAKPRVKAVGVNGELIDVGISKRNSVELAEHWHDVEIVERNGVRVAGIPVPTLPYFVDDFSTIIRDALATGTADRKLAKRLVRLNRVLEADDAALTAAAADAKRLADAALPQGSAALVGAVGTVGGKRLAAWVLAALLRSLPDARTSPGWLAALDAWLAGNVGALLDAGNVAALWDELEDALSAPDRPSCHEVLLVEDAAGRLSRQVAADGGVAAAAVSGPYPDAGQLWDAVSRAIAAVMALNTRDGQSGAFYLTGELAARMQTAHAGVDPAGLGALCVNGAIEMTVRPPSRVPLDRALAMIVDRLNGVIAGVGLKAMLVGQGDDQAVVVMTGAPIRGVVISAATPAVMLIRPEGQGADRARVLDYLDGWAVASTRDLTRRFEARAAASPDYDLRRARGQTASFLLANVLGRQLQ